METYAALAVRPAMAPNHCPALTESHGRLLDFQGC